jgi:hypothetical protein
MCERCTHLESEIAKYRARLEVDRHFAAVGNGPLKRVDVPYVSADEDIGDYDGISCRDETIKLQDENLKRLRAQASP